MKRLLAISIVLFFPLVVFAEDATNLLKPINKAESWRLEQHEGAQGTLKIADDAATFNATKVTGTNWHVQAFQTDLDLKDGQEYTLKLKLTASQPRKVMLVALVDGDDWHEIARSRSDPDDRGQWTGSPPSLLTDLETRFPADLHFIRSLI